MKALFKQSKGFTLIELMVVMTILSVLAGIVVPAVTGTTTIGRGAALTSDIVTVQQAVDRFAGENPSGTDKGWPTGDWDTSGGKGTLPATGSVPIDWGASFDKDGSKKIFLITYLRGSVTHSGATRGVKPTDGIDIKTIISPLKAIDVTAATHGELTDGNIKVTYNGTTVTRTSSAGSNWPGGGGTGDNGDETVGKDIIAVASGKLPAYPVWRLDQYGKVIIVMGENEY